MPLIKPPRQERGDFLASVQFQYRRGSVNTDLDASLPAAYGGPDSVRPPHASAIVPDNGSPPEPAEKIDRKNAAQGAPPGDRSGVG